MVSPRVAYLAGRRQATVRSSPENEGTYGVMAEPRWAAVRCHAGGGHDAGRAVPAPFAKQIHRHEEAAASMSSNWPRSSPSFLAMPARDTPTKSSCCAKSRSKVRQCIEEHEFLLKFARKGSKVSLTVVAHAQRQGAQGGRRELPISRHPCQDWQRHRRPRAFAKVARPQEPRHD